MTALNAEQAAKRVGMTVDELMVSRARGLPPGILGFRPHHTEPLVWLSEELLPPPEKLACPDCGFKAKSKGGLTLHRKRHG